VEGYKVNRMPNGSVVYTFPPGAESLHVGYETMLQLVAVLWNLYDFCKTSWVKLRKT